MSHPSSVSATVMLHGGIAQDAADAPARLVGSSDGLHGNSTETQEPRFVMNATERDYSARSLFEKLGIVAEAHVALVGRHLVTVPAWLASSDIHFLPP